MRDQGPHNVQFVAYLHTTLHLTRVNQTFVVVSALFLKLAFEFIPWLFEKLRLHIEGIAVKTDNVLVALRAGRLLEFPLHHSSDSNSYFFREKLHVPDDNSFN